MHSFQQITNRYEEAQETIEDMRKRSEITQEEIIGYQHASKAFKSEIQVPFIETTPQLSNLLSLIVFIFLIFIVFSHTNNSK